MVLESDKFSVANPRDDTFGGGKELGFCVGGLQEVSEEITFTLSGNG